MNKEKLANCPFCGKIPKLVEIASLGKYPTKYFVECRCGGSTGWSKYKEKVIKIWNTRINK